MVHTISNRGKTYNGKSCRYLCHGAIPKYLLVAAGISELNNSETVTELAKGIRSVADKFEVTVIGGDLSKSEK